MKLSFTLLGIISLCLLCSISGLVTSDNFKECKSGSCVPLEKCSSLIELNAKILANTNPNSNLSEQLSSLQCDYKPYEKLSYYCCADEKIVDNESKHVDFSEHPNRHLFLTDDCGYLMDNVASFNSPLNKASLYEYAWTALIKYNGTLISSGTLINDRYVLTSARHAEYFMKGIENMEIILGEYDMESNPDCEIYRNGKSDCTFTVNVGVEEIHVHPGFSKKYLTNDIALLRLNKQIEFSLNVEPICLPFANEVSLLDIPYDVYGHGVSLLNGYESTVTLKNEVEIMETYKCSALYRESNSNRKIDDSVVCVKPKIMPNICVPDDGGDLSHLFRRTLYQLGVASFDTDRCSLNLPFVYTKLAPHLKWILDTVRE